MRKQRNRGLARWDRWPSRRFERLEDRRLLTAPALLAGVQVQAGGVALAVDSPGYAIPTVGDWNGDGKKDLIVGQYANGNIWVYLNQGTNASPSFGSRTAVLCNGSAITTSYG
jgi:hypothetical protein